MSTPSSENFLSPPDVLLVSGTQFEAQLQGDSLDLGPQVLPSSSPLLFLIPGRRLSQSFIFMYTSFDKLKQGFPGAGFAYRVHLTTPCAVNGMFAVLPDAPADQGSYIVCSDNTRLSIFRLVWNINLRLEGACGGAPAADYELQRCDVNFDTNFNSLERSTILASRKSYYSRSLDVENQRIAQFVIKDGDDDTSQVAFTNSFIINLR